MSYHYFKVHCQTFDFSFFNSLFIFSATTTEPVKCWAALPIRNLMQGILKVLVNKLAISFFLQWRIHLSSYPKPPFGVSSNKFPIIHFLILQARFFQSDVRVVYCLIQASTRSFHFQIFMYSSLIYQFNTAPLKLS